ncbi:MAG TPA: BT_3928 family protein, partial [Chitinophagaceae bacterium]|nr:BT_3928 family protein [Chitinophagaceae bacterium]
IRIFVGLLFIFSGLVKANDPLGTAYKMEEYFEVWNAGLATSSFFLKDALMSLFHFLNDHTLFLSVTMNAFEIIAGAALLLGWRMKLFSWLLLLLMIFFTILTGYTYKTGQPKNCGCFGDCIKITSEFSFYKDVLLSALILILLFTRKHIMPLFSPRLNTALMFLVTIFSFGLQWYSLRYLPPVDCLPFKKGNSIPEKMKLPVDAVPDSIAMTFVYEKQGQKVEFTADKFPADFNDSLYKFVDRYDKVVRKGKNNEPPIKGFSLTGPKSVDSTGIETITDSTGIILAQPVSLLLFNTELPGKDPAWRDELLGVYEEANKKGIPFYFVTNNRDSAIAVYSQMGIKSANVLSCDFTAIRTAARSNPTLYLLNHGVVKDKWSFANFDEAAKALKK